MSLFSVLVDIAANTASIESGLKRSEALLEHFGEQAKEVGETAKEALEFAGIGLGLEELKESFEQLVSYAVNVEHAAEKTALSVEAFQKLEFAAKQAGIGSEQLTTGLEKFAKSAEAAAGGSEKEAAAFAAMGIAVRDSSGHLKPMQELLDQVADKFAGYKDSLEKTALAQMIFGRAGADLIPLLNEGSKGIEEYGKRHEELGALMTEGDIKAAAAFHQKLNEVHDVIGGIWKSIAGQLLPPLTALADNFVRGAREAGGLTAQIQPMTNALRFLMDVGFSVYRTFVDLGDAIGAVMAIGVELAKGHFSQVKSIWKDYEEQSKESERRANETLKAIYGEAGDTLDKLGDKAEENAGKMAAPIVEIGKHIQTVAEQMDEFFAKLNGETGKQLSTAGFDLGKRAAEEAGRAIDKQHEQWLKAHEKTMDQMTLYADQAARNIQSAFANFLFDPFKGGVRGMAVEFINIIRRMLAEAASAQILKALFGQGYGTSGGSSGLGGIFGGLLKSVFGSGSSGVGSDAASLAATAGNDMSFLDGAFADGGYAQSGKSYLVGENGPEIFTPGASGFVTPNGMGGGFNGDMHFHTNIDARGADADRVMTLIPPLLQQRDAQLKYDMLQAWRRSGLPAPLRA